MRFWKCREHRDEIRLAFPWRRLALSQTCPAAYVMACFARLLSKVAQLQY